MFQLCLSYLEVSISFPPTIFKSVYLMKNTEHAQLHLECMDSISIVAFLTPYFYANNIAFTVHILFASLVLFVLFYF